MGFIVENKEKGWYELTLLEKDIAMLIPYETLTLLVDTLSANTISTYVYLFKRYYANC